MSMTKRALPARGAMMRHESLQPYKVEHIKFAHQTEKKINQSMADMAVKASRHVVTGKPGPDCPSCRLAVH